MRTRISGLVRSPAVLALLAINVIVWVAQLVDPDVAEALLLRSGPATLVGRPWTLLTVLFLHELIVHLAMLVAVLLIFGLPLERITRPRHVLLIYLAAGIVGSLLIVLVSAGMGWDERMVGSSAAFHGIAGAFIAMRPEAAVPGGKGKHYLIALLAFNVLLLPASPLSSLAHLAGLAVGLLYGRGLRTRKPAPVIAGLD